MQLIKKLSNKSYKAHLWEVYSKKSNVMVTKEGKLIRVNVSGPKAVEEPIGQLV